MRRRTADTGGIPDELRTYDPARWIGEAIDEGDLSLSGLRHRSMSRAQLVADYYCRFIVGPSHYRRALAKAIGARAGDEYFSQVLDVQGHAFDGFILDGDGAVIAIE